MEWCENCSGSGRISCGACWGGHTKAVCPDCMGAGEVLNNSATVQCLRCHGTGKITPKSCPHCGNSVLCPVCQ